MTPSESERSWIARLIWHYLRSARELSQRLSEAFHQPDLVSGRQSKAIPRTGTAPNGLEFRFHGIGCWLSDGSTTVDFDFTPNGELNGFDAWRLHSFSEDNPFVVGARTQDEVQEALDGLVERGRIERIPGSMLYRLRPGAQEEGSQ